MIVPVAITGAVILFLAGRGGKGKGKGKKGNGSSDRPPWTDPLLWDEATVIAAATAEACRLGPLVADDRLAGSVWESLYPAIPWPLLAGDHATVRAAGALVAELAGEYLVDPASLCGPDGPGPGPEPEPEPGPGPAPVNVEEIEDSYPTPGRFYQVEAGDLFGGEISDRSIVYRALLSAGFLAAKNLGGYDDGAASQYARTIAKSEAARAVYLDRILCVHENDQLYGTYGYGAGASAGAHGRSIRLMRYHAPNRARLKAGHHAIRKIALGKPADAGTGTGTGDGNSYEYLWLPAINLERLWDSGTWEDRIDSAGLTWEDGSSQFRPPPEVRQLVAVELLPKGVQYGC